MRLKTNLHFHSAEDDAHNIPYSLFQGIDCAAECGFDVLAVTCHRKYVCTKEHIRYAAEKNILLLPGIEADIYAPTNRARRSHIVILNCEKDAENIRTFDELALYKKLHPEIFILAPHPYFFGRFSLHGFLEEYIHLFDAIEHSWFYSKSINRNKKAKEAALRYNLPFIATSDTHMLDYLDTDYALIDAKEKTPHSIFDAIRKKKLENITRPKRLFYDMARFATLCVAKDAIIQKDSLKNIFKTKNCAKDARPFH